MLSLRSFRVATALLCLSTAGPLAGQRLFADSERDLFPIDDYGAYGVATGDLDGDGRPDLVVRSWFPTEQWLAGRAPNVYFGNGDGTWTPAPPTSDPLHVELVDVDGDLDLDVVCANGCRGLGCIVQEGPRQTTFVDDGAGTLTELPLGTNRTVTVALAVGDLDEDGDPDFVFGNEDRVSGNSPDDFVVLNDWPTLNVARADAAARIPVNVLDATDRILADFDGDGDPDLLSIDSDLRGSALDPDLRLNRLLVNLQRHLVAPQPLRSGYPYPLAAHGATAGAFVLLGWQADRAPTAFGTLGIQAQSMSLLATLPPPASGRVAGTVVPVPPIPALAGLRLYAQALVFDGGGARLTNTIEETVLVW